MYNITAARAIFELNAPPRALTMDEKEIELIRQCQVGNSEAFGYLYDSYFEKIYKYIFYRIQSKELAEDLTSQVFIKGLEKISSFNPRKGNFSAWIYRIARNTLFDHYRTNHQALDLEEAGEVPSSENVERTVEAREKLRKVQDYLKTIPEDQRDIILLRVWDGLSYKEIGDILGKSEASCQMAFSRAIAKMQKEIALALIWLLIFYTTLK